MSVVWGSEEGMDRECVVVYEWEGRDEKGIIMEDGDGDGMEECRMLLV